jgi:Ca-activated chloride channel family protein
MEPTQHIAETTQPDRADLQVINQSVRWVAALRLVGALTLGVATLVIAVPDCLAQGQEVIAGIGSPQEVQMVSGLQYATLLMGSNGQAQMVIDLTAPALPRATQRPAMSVALVIDRSGSMAGDKMGNAISAAASFIQNLSDGDVVAIYAYDDVVDQLAPPTPVNAATRPGLLAAVGQLFPRGSTNLHGGLMAGVAALSRPGAERPLRRVILISDGLANVGPSSPIQLGQAAANASYSGISVTAIGVGLDYDEAVLGALAVRSGGRFYHLQEPGQMAIILQSELEALTQTVARGLSIELIPAPGVQVLDATGADVVRNGRRVQLRLGDMLGGQSRAVVVDLRLPTAGGPERQAAQLIMSYQAASSGANREASDQVIYQISRSPASVQASVTPRYALLVERHQAALAQQRAAEMLGRGESDGAGNVLQAQAQQLRRRARAIGGAEGQEMEQEAQRAETAERRARRANSRPARRAAQLDMADDALGSLGF